MEEAPGILTAPSEFGYQKVRGCRMVWLIIWGLLGAGLAEAGKSQPPTNVSELRLPEASNEAFRFGAGDAFSVTVYRHDDLDAELLVAPDGSVTVPLLGRVVVAGKTYTELVSELEAGWSKYYTDVSVAVNV